jgi:hypothetical protein
MRPTIFDATSRQRLLDRIDRLQPNSARRWGRMTPNEMICHLEDSLRCATGITPAHCRQSLMSTRLASWIIIHVIPWPKGKAKTVKEMQATRPGEFETDRQRLQTMLSAAAERGRAGEWAPHPAFGNLTGRDYGVLIYRHIDHHLTQFGV